MERYFYDFHLHSCLSPCADNDMTPSNIAGMGMLAGLQILALTDHNSTANCPAFFRAAEAVGVIPVPGMELETAENIHVVCLFETLSGAMSFGEEVAGRRFPIKNRPEIYGEQLIVDHEDNILGSDPKLLVVATGIALYEVPELVDRHGGVCYPAHIDRPSNGIIAILGDIPPDFPTECVELNDMSKREELMKSHPSLSGKKFLSGSDAHRLDAIRDAEHTIYLDGDTPDEIRKNLIRSIKLGRI